MKIDSISTQKVKISVDFYTQWNLPITPTNTIMSSYINGSEYVFIDAPIQINCGDANVSKIDIIAEFDHTNKLNDIMYDFNSMNAITKIYFSYGNEWEELYYTKVTKVIDTNTWSTQVEYNVGDVVLFDDFYYICVFDTFNNPEPPLNNSEWSVMSTFNDCILKKIEKYIIKSSNNEHILFDVDMNPVRLSDYDRYQLNVMLNSRLMDTLILQNYVFNIMVGGSETALYTDFTPTKVKFSTSPLILDPITIFRVNQLQTWVDVNIDNIDHKNFSFFNDNLFKARYYQDEPFLPSISKTFLEMLNVR